MFLCCNKINLLIQIWPKCHQSNFEPNQKTCNGQWSPRRLTIFHIPVSHQNAKRNAVKAEKIERKPAAVLHACELSCAAPCELRHTLNDVREHLVRKGDGRSQTISTHIFHGDGERDVRTQNGNNRKSSVCGMRYAQIAHMRGPSSHARIYLTYFRFWRWQEPNKRRRIFRGGYLRRR